MSGYKFLHVWLLLVATLIPTSLYAESSSQPGMKSSNDFERILIAGNGPERHLLETLASAFEQRHPTISVDFFWHPNAKPIRTIELGEADIGITGDDAPKELRSVPFARDGIAIVTNFSNPVKEISTKQVADVFSGKVRYWSDVYEEAPQTKIVIINRTQNQNIRQGLERLLQIPNGIPRSAIQAESEGQAIKLVSGKLDAVTFISMAPALRAKEDGIAINLLFIDKIEPEVQTVLDKRYPLQHPIMLVTQATPSPQVRLFEEFILSPAGQALVKKGKYYPLQAQ
ncbi:MAG: substrate-binding domain-containing protein [Nitrospirales bacterium]